MDEHKPTPAIANYSPSQEAIELVKNTKILLLVGIAGAGKDTIKQQLLKLDTFQDIVSHTTRAPRTNNGIPEVDHVDYHFIDTDTALRMAAGHEFIEIKQVHDTIYGTSIGELKLSMEADKIATTDIDVQGVDEYKMLSQAVIAVFILPPSYKVWRDRLAQRYPTPEAFAAEWPKRRASAIKELNRSLAVPYYHFLINDDLERAVRVTEEMAERGDSFVRQDDEARLMARNLLQEIIDNE